MQFQLPDLNYDNSNIFLSFFIYLFFLSIKHFFIGLKTPQKHQS